MRSSTLALSAFAFLAAVAAPTEAAAKAAYRDLADTVRTAQIIAVVEVESATPASLEGKHWTYSQRVIARPVEVIEGKISERFAIAASRDFICAPVPYDAPGTYLVFLARDGAVLATENNEWGRLRIDGDTVEWPYADGGGTVATSQALAEIRALLGAEEPVTPPQPEPAPEAAEPTPEPPIVDSPPAVAPVVDSPAVEPSADRGQMECGYAAGHREARRFGGPPLWIATGALAVGLGFVVASRSRRR